MEMPPLKLENAQALFLLKFLKTEKTNSEKRTRRNIGKF